MLTTGRVATALPMIMEKWANVSLKWWLTLKTHLNISYPLNHVNKKKQNKTYWYAYLCIFNWLHSNSAPIQPYSWYTCIHCTTGYTGHFVNLCLGPKLCTLTLFSVPQTVIHELFHVLGFSKHLFHTWRACSSNATHFETGVLFRRGYKVFHAVYDTVA